MLSSLATLAAAIALAAPPAETFAETPEARDARMAWWREARFGMFIHWGVYAVPAGIWNEKPQGSAGEWIQHIARIPTRDYEPLRHAFDPVEFDADEWCRIALDAGMKYIVITTKHHDGFALFDSAVTEWDIMATPFRRDIMAELADACHRHGLRLGWYHSILDWHHPDYEPKEDWSDLGPGDFDAYKAHLFAQVREILTKYGPIDVMWFDGEWDATWTHADGLRLDAFVRELQPDIVVNNRVDKGRYPDAPGAHYAGDFGTPEQHIPATGLPGVDWETCMTMNGTWGFKRHDHEWKSTRTLVHNLVDIASKGGSFLLNVGPNDLGRIPGPSIARLRAVGAWLAVNGDSVYGTQASPFTHLPAGLRCTMRPLEDGGTRLFLHVLEDWPEDEGRLAIPGLANRPRRAFLLADSTEQPLPVVRDEDALVVAVAGAAPDAIDSVVVLDIDGAPAVGDPPVIEAPHDRFWRHATVRLTAPRAGTVVRYTLDGSTPTADAPVAREPIDLHATTVVSARAFDGATPVSGTSARRFEAVPLVDAETVPLESGVEYIYYEADLNSWREMGGLEPVASGVSEGFDLDARRRDEHFAFRYDGFLVVPEDGMYTLTLSSDDGAVLRIAGRELIDHDGLHAAIERTGRIALAAGAHALELQFFEKGGLEVLDVWIEGPRTPRQRVEGQWLGHRRQ